MVASKQSLPSHRDYGNKKVAQRAPSTMYFPSHPKQQKVQTMYPRLYRWDKMQQQKVKMGLISKEEYLKSREENFAQISDSEEEKEEIKRIDSQLSRVKTRMTG